jgi:hypothetical protein
MGKTSRGTTLAIVFTLAAAASTGAWAGDPAPEPQKALDALLASSYDPATGTLAENT